MGKRLSAGRRIERGIGRGGVRGLWRGAVGLFAVLVAAGTMAGTLTLPLVDQTELDTSRYSIYVLGYAMGSAGHNSVPHLLTVDSDKVGHFVLYPSDVADSVGVINSYKLGSEITRIEMDYSTPLLDTEKIDGNRTYFFVADNTDTSYGPGRPTFPYTNYGYGVGQPNNPPNPSFPPFSYIEFSYDSSDYGWVIDNSTVDGFIFPVTVTLSAAEGVEVGAGADTIAGETLTPNPAFNRDAILKAYPPFMAAQGAAGAPYLDLAYSENQGGLLNPTTYLTAQSSQLEQINASSPLNTAFDAAVNTLFSNSNLSLQGIATGGILADIYTVVSTDSQIYPTTNFYHPALQFKGTTYGHVLNVFNPVGLCVASYTDGNGDLQPIIASIDNSGTMTFQTALPADTPILVGMNVAGAGVNPSTTVGAINRNPDNTIASVTLSNYPGGIPTPNCGYIFSKVNYIFSSSGTMVFGCMGVFADANGNYTGDEQAVLQNLQNQISAALNRGVANLAPNSGAPGYTSAYWGTETNWYPQGAPQNLFSLFVHTATVPVGSSNVPIFTQPLNPVACARGTLMGKAYGFGFDEAAGPVPPAPNNQPAVPSKFDPVPGVYTTMTITLGRWAGSSQTYTIDAMAGANGTISPSGSVSVAAGADQAFSIRPDSGYRIADVTVDGVSVGAVTQYQFTAVSANHAIAASFEVIPPSVFVITATAGVNGTITPRGEVSVNSGADQAFAIAASDGYRIAEVMVDGASVGAVSTYEFVNVTANHTIAASFEAIPTTKYTIAATAGPNGSISPSGAVSVLSGADQTFVIKADAGYRIANVMVDGVSVGTVTAYTFDNVTADHAISATFEVIPPSVFVVAATAGPNGTISPHGEVSVNSGGDQSFSIIANSGYRIANVIVDGASVGAVSSYEFTNVIANHAIAASFELIPVTRYTIAAAAGANGKISPSGAVSVIAGANQSFSIAANNGYRIANVIVDGASLGTVTHYQFTAVSANHTISATFEVIPSSVFVIAAAAGPNGTIDPSGEVSVDSGNNQRFAIAANNGYRIANVIVDGASVGAVATYDFTDVIANHTIAASFELIPTTKHTIVATAGPNGTIAPNGDVSVTAGADQTFVIAANSGYRIANVLVDGVSIGKVTRYTFMSVSANHTIAATFEVIPPSVFVIAATAGVNGTITPNGEVSVASGNNQRFAIAANSGYRIAAVVVDGQLVGTVSEYEFVNVTANHTIAATFAAVPVPKYTITAMAGADGAISPSGSVSVTSGASQTFQIAANSGYRIADVVVDGASVGAVSSYEFVNVTANHTIAAAFEIIPATHTVTFVAGANGTLSDVHGTGPLLVREVIDGGSCAPVTAIPDARYRFVTWDSGFGTANPLTVTNVRSNMTINAAFAIQTFLLTYVAGANGSLSGELVQTVNYGASGSPVEAVPNTGYHFVSWSDGSTANPRTDADVTADLSVTATFAINVYTVTFAATEGGSVEGQTTQLVEYGGSCSPVEAVRDQDYDFTGWDNGFGMTNPLTVTDVVSNMDITASFTKKAKPEYWVAQGSVFSVLASDLGMTAFEKKPNVQAINQVTNKKGGKAKVLNFQKGLTLVWCVWMGKDQPGTYGLLVNKVSLTSEFDVMNPNAFDTTLSPDTGMAGDILTVTGMYFGSKCPKVVMEFVDAYGKHKKVTCKVLKPYAYPDAEGKANNSVMNVDTGESLLRFAVPGGISLSTPATITITCVGNAVQLFFNAEK